VSALLADVAATHASTWELKPLAEVADILDGKRIPVNAKEREKRPGSVAYYGATGQVGWIDDFLFDEELVLLGEDGAPFLEPSKPKAYVIRGKSWVNNHAHVLRARAVPTGWLAHYLNAVGYDGLVTGTTRLKLTQAAMRQICVPVAPWHVMEQRVAEIEKQFSRLDEAVANLKRVKANLKRYKAAILKAAVEGRLVPTEAELARTEGRAYESGAELLVRILEERRASWAGRYELPLRAELLPSASLPDGWSWCTVSQLMRERIVNGLSIKESTHPTATRALRLSALTEEGLDYFDHRFLPIEPVQVGDITVQTGDFFVSRGNGSLELVGRGATAQAPPHPVIFPDTMMRVRFLSGDLTRWVQMLWPSRLVRTQIESRVKTTAGIYKISQPQVASIIVPLPPVDEQRRILATVDHRLSSIRRASREVEANRARAEALRQSVLARSFVRPKAKTLRGDVGAAL
jgi:type I restriction enzyme, S subunit